MLILAWITLITFILMAILVFLDSFNKIATMGQVIFNAIIFGLPISLAILVIRSV